MSLVIRDNAILATFPHWLVRLTFADLCLRFSFDRCRAQTFDSKRHRLNTRIGEARANVSISERVYFPEMLYL
jgi:hypothetical protein